MESITTPVPGPLKELCCDTCHQIYPELWIFNHGRIEIVFSGKETNRFVYAQGQWGACDTCARLLMDKDVHNMALRCAGEDADLRVLVVMQMLFKELIDVLVKIQPKLMNLEQVNRKYYSTAAKEDTQ